MACAGKLLVVFDVAASARLQPPDGDLCDARRPAAPLHPDAALAGAAADFDARRVRRWAAARAEATAAAVRGFGKLTALVAGELAEAGGGGAGGAAPSPALLGEALALLARAKHIFELEAGGDAAGDDALSTLAAAEARIREQWVPS